MSPYDFNPRPRPHLIVGSIRLCLFQQGVGRLGLEVQNRWGPPDSNTSAACPHHSLGGASAAQQAQRAVASFGLAVHLVGPRRTPATGHGAGDHGSGAGAAGGVPAKPGVGRTY